MELIGADGCRGGWVLARSGPDLAELRFEIVPGLEGIAAEARAGHVTAIVDIPIGLPDSGPREADLAARRVLGPRAGSVFPAPCRSALAAGCYRDACELNAAACGKRIPIQAWGILPKIAAVDRLLDPALQDRLREGHPEVSFAVLAGHPMRYPKKSGQGQRERLEVLASAGVRFHLEGVRRELGRGRVAPDDLLDAAACLLTARRVVEGRACVLPERKVCRDGRGLRMEIVA